MDLPELTGLDKEILLNTLLAEAVKLHAEAAADLGAAGVAKGFWLERVRYALEQRGFSHETVRAATSPEEISPLRARRVADVLQTMRMSADFQALAVLFKRVKNIARERTDDGAADRSALTEPAERALLDELDARSPRIAAAISAADYKRAFTEIAGLRPAVDRFFTEVFVMAEDRRVRGARLALMAELRDLILQLADISEIVPQTE